MSMDWKAFDRGCEELRPCKGCKEGLYSIMMSCPICGYGPAPYIFGMHDGAPIGKRASKAKKTAVLEKMRMHAEGCESRL